MDKVLILGVNGFTGKHFQEYIVKNKLLKRFTFVGIDSSVGRLIDIDYIRLDLTDLKRTESLILRIKPDYIINFAGTFDQSDFNRMFNINAEISRNILEVIARNAIPVKKILFVGSAAEYGKAKRLPIRENTPLLPVSLYGLTKSIQSMYADYYANNFNIKLNIARTFNIAGRSVSKSLCVGSFTHQIKKAKQNDVLAAGNLKTKRDFLNIEDVIDAYWKILLRGKSGEVYNVCSGKSRYIKEILDYLIKESGKKIKVEVKKEKLRKLDIMDSFGSNLKLRKDTGWKEKKGIFAGLKQALEG